jgi:hypothetical protein
MKLDHGDGVAAQPPALIEVSDLFDAFHSMANHVLVHFELRDADLDEAGVEPGFDVLIDQLEIDVFLTACARRVYLVRGCQVYVYSKPRVWRRSSSHRQAVNAVGYCSRTLASTSSASPSVAKNPRRKR